MKEIIKLENLEFQLAKEFLTNENKIKDIDSKITFWLDSHWSGTPDVGCDLVTICPVLEELEQIKQHSIKTHTIIYWKIKTSYLKEIMEIKLM
jgi:hypothetical protein